MKNNNPSNRFHQGGPNLTYYTLVYSCRRVRKGGKLDGCNLNDRVHSSSEGRLKGFPWLPVLPGMARWTGRAGGGGASSKAGMAYNNDGSGSVRSPGVPEGDPALGLKSCHGRLPCSLRSLHRLVFCLPCTAPIHGPRRSPALDPRPPAPAIADGTVFCP